MPRENQIKLSGLWLSEPQNGQKYFKGSNNGQKDTIFKNSFKEKDSQPDYNLYVEPLEQEQKQVNWESSPKVPDTNELPF